MLKDLELVHLLGWNSRSLAYNWIFDWDPLKYWSPLCDRYNFVAPDMALQYTCSAADSHSHASFFI